MPSLCGYSRLFSSKSLMQAAFDVYLDLNWLY
jgi:hypothetical protein